MTAEETSAIVKENESILKNVSDWMDQCNEDEYTDPGVASETIYELCEALRRATNALKSTVTAK